MGIKGGNQNEKNLSHEEELKVSIRFMLKDIQKDGSNMNQEKKDIEVEETLQLN